MIRRGGYTRHLAAAAGLVATVAVLVRIALLPLDAGIRVAEVLLWALVLVLVAASHRLTRLGYWSGALIVLYSLAPALVAGVALRIVTPQLPDYATITTLVFAAILLSTDFGAALSAALLSLAAVLIVFVELWLDTVGVDISSVGSLVVAVVVLACMRALLLGEVQRVRNDIAAQSMRGHVFSSLARRLGTAGDVASVTAAVLDVCHETFPQATSGVLVLRDDHDGMLRSPGVALRHAGVSREEERVELAPGEGLAGALFSRPDAHIWQTALEVSTVHRTLREATRQRLREQTYGFIRSAIGAPLRDRAGRAFGSIVLASFTHERAWTHADLDTMSTIAEEAARNLERAREHARIVPATQRDEVTGLLMHGEFRTVLEREVSRAEERDGTLGVIVFNLDGLDGIGDAWGVDARDSLVKLFADIVLTTLRQEDTAGRRGVSEFACVLPDADDEQTATVAARIASRFNELLRGGDTAGPMSVTVSTGTAVFPRSGDGATPLLAAALRDRGFGSRERTVEGRGRRWVRRQAAPEPERGLTSQVE